MGDGSDVDLTTQEIYLFRHGETVWNTKGKRQGSLDSPLTPKGRDQASHLGRLLRTRFGKTCPYALHISPLGRAQETAALVQAEIAFPAVYTDSDLREASFGLFEGKTFEEIRSLFPEEAKYEKTFRLTTPPEGEPYIEIRDRAVKWLEGLTEPVIAISHAAFGKTLRGLYLGLTREKAIDLKMTHGVIWHLAKGREEKIS